MIEAIIQKQVKAIRQLRIDRNMPKPEKRVELPCIHRGSPCAPPEGRDVRKAWFRCDLGYGEEGKVCGCVNCGCLCNAKCEGYEADDV